MSHLGFVVGLGELKLILSKVKDGMVWTRHPETRGNSLKHKYEHPVGKMCSGNKICV